MIEELEVKYLMHEPYLIILGDLNLPLEAEYNKSGPESLRAKQLKEFFDGLGLKDCWKSDDKRITFKTSQSRLDRILYRIEGEFETKLETDWTFTASDHCLLHLDLKKVKLTFSRRIVSLPTYILENKDNVEYIKRGLEEFLIMCGEQWSAAMKLEFAKMGLRTVVGECIKEYNKKVNGELADIQKEINRRVNFRRTLPLHLDIKNKEEIDGLFLRRNAILEERSKKLAEKAKTKWFHEGEKSNKFFLNLLRKKREMTQIEKLVINDEVIDSEDRIKEEIGTFYKKLYEKGGNINIKADFYQHVQKVEQREAIKTTALITKDELFQVLKTCDDSAPGPDGISYSYYKEFWHYFGDLIIDAWNESLQTGELPVSHKSSILRLLPKAGKDLNLISNWRPITLSNCDHKIITKCYSKRLTTVLCDRLHSSQTAYLPGKQIQDNLRLINIVKEKAPESLIVALDAKKAFDSINHEYIRRTLSEYGLFNFVQVFDLLYHNQKVDIAINGDIIEGYNIKNGVKQGDSLSCILFILCMDPLIRNIEMNAKIERVEHENLMFPKIVAYADDITCMTTTSRSIKHIFKEYEKLSKASNLLLNADKTVILDDRVNSHVIKYMGQIFEVNSSKRVKINGITFVTDDNVMREINYENLKTKIVNILTSWQTRQLSFLGRILIYKTFGLSQVTYPLSIVNLEQCQYSNLNKIFYNFICGRDLNSNSKQFRIAKDRMYTPIEKGGFGMIDYTSIVEGIRCRQIGKFYNPNFNHPLKYIIIKEGLSFYSGYSLTNSADEVAKIAQKLLLDNFHKQLKNCSEIQLMNDLVMIEQVGEIDIARIIKTSYLNRPETNRLVHMLQCRNIRDITNVGRAILPLINKTFKSPYLRIIKLLINNNIQCPEISIDKMKMKNGRYKILFETTSKEFREALKGEDKYLNSKLIDGLCDQTKKRVS